MENDMRRGLENGFLFDNGTLIGVNLGADFVAEHELGIPGIRQSFGMTDKGYGIERRLIRRIPEGSHRFGEQFGWIFLPHYKASGFCLTYELNSDMRLRDAFFNREHTLYTGWSGEDLGAFSTNQTEIEHLKEIYDAMRRLDACIWTGSGHAFKRAGLVVGITSRIPKAHLTAWEKHDREAEALVNDAKETGIEARLKAAGKEWYALSPNRSANGQLRFWLNPMGQRNNNFGWFTVEELDAWITGKGPIPKP
jgi:hypothetical protein